MTRDMQVVTVSMLYTGALVLLHTGALSSLKHLIQSTSGLLSSPSVPGIHSTPSSGGSGTAPGANSGGGNGGGGGGSF